MVREAGPWHARYSPRCAAGRSVHEDPRLRPGRWLH